MKDNDIFGRFIRSCLINKSQPTFDLLEILLAHIKKQQLMRAILLHLRTNLLFNLLIVFLFLKADGFAQIIDMQLSNRRSVKPDWFGIGSQNTTREGMYIDHPDLLEHAPDMNAKVIRFPSGGNSNWWDWKTGWFVDDPNVPPHNPNQAPVYNTLENFKVLVDATGAVPLFALNMISSTLAYQLEMLHYADSLGMEVKYIELGNEFYLAEEEDSSYIYSIFPDAQTYGIVASKWIDSIHAHFPEAKVAAQGAFNRNNQSRRVLWDGNLLETLEGEDAITFHQYFSSSGTEAKGEGDGKYNANDVVEFLYRPFKAWNILATEDLPLVRPGKEVWITEYNLQDFNIPVHGSWGHALFVATQTLHYLESEKITNVNFHTVCGTAGYGGYFIDMKGFKFKDDGSFKEPPNPPITTSWAKTSSGHAVQIISEAVDGMKYASELSFAGAPAIAFAEDDETVTYPSLYGWQFSNDNTSTAIIVNLSGSEQKIKTTDVFKSGGDYKRIAAAATDYIANDGDILKKNSNLPATLTVKEYSITKITSNYVPDAPPVVSISAAGATTFCQGDSVNLDAGGGYFAYQWSTGETSRKIWAKNSGDYWIRVWDEKAGYWAADTIKVTANPLPETPTIKNTGKDAFCAGSNTVLIPKKLDPTATYVWSNGFTGTELTVTTQGNYQLTVIDQNGCSSVSLPASIVVHPLPQAIVNPSGPLAFCDGGSVTLDAGSGFKSYKWSNGKYGQSLIVKAAGAYSVTITDFNSCVKTSAATQVTIYPLPSTNVTVNGPTAFCEGSTSTYLVAPSGYASYQWVKGGNNIAGATDKKYYPISSGTYKVTITDNFSCLNQSDGVVATMLNLPKAKVTIDGSKNICNGETRTLTASAGSGYSYQWLKNSVNINGATQMSYVVSTAGDFKCKVTDANGCKENSKITTITSICKEAETVDNPGSGTTLSIYPNPSTNVVFLQADFTDQVPMATLEITNLLGALVYREQIALQGTLFQTELSLTEQFTNGLYVAIVRCGSQVAMSKFVVAGKR
jgi:hypothetical protein